MSKTTYLHIGLTKTGTSALQLFFLQNRHVLQKHGVAYPEHALDDNGVSSGNASHLALCLRDGNYARARKTASQLTDVEQEKILLSSEFLGYALGRGEIEQLGDLFPCAKVIVFLRRQDAVIVSKYNQRVKRAGYVIPLADWIDEIVQQPDQMHDLLYDRVLTDWSSVFGRENVVVRLYEKQQFHDQNIFSDFLHHGLAMELTGEFALALKRINRSYCEDALEFKRLSNSLSLKGNPLDAPLQAYTDNIEEAPRCGLMSPQQCKDVMALYSQTNSIVARDYFSRHDGRLFHDVATRPEGPWRPYPGLTPERIQEIASFLRSYDPKISKKFAKAIARGARSRNPDMRHAATSLAAATESLLESRPRLLIETVVK